MIKYTSSIRMLAVGFLVLGFPNVAEAQHSVTDVAEERGSVIVFPKFTRGTLTTDNQKWPMTEIEIRAQCPEGATCLGNEAVKVRFHWVCPASNDIAAKYVCKAASFDISIPLNSKASFNPEDPGGLGENPAASAPCPSGYLIGWVINSATDRPIKYDALSGAATFRDSEGKIERYNGIAVRAEPNLASGGEITTDPDPRTGAPALIFDGAAGHYRALGAAISQDLDYHKLTGPLSSERAFLVLLTLDVRLNRPNYPTFVDFEFRSDQDVRATTAQNFTCWAEIKNPNIDAYFTLTGTRTNSGIVLAGRAIKVPFADISDIPGPVSLLGLVPAEEGRGNRSMDAAYIIQRFDKLRMGRAARSLDPADVARWAAGKPTSVFVP